MSYPTEPKSIQVRDRFLVLLRDIVEGDGYFKTPGAVFDRMSTWKERDAWPAYAAYFGGGGDWKEHQGLQAAETITVIVYGEVQDDEDAPAAVRRAVRDVRKAVMDDAAGGGVATSLQALCVHTTLGELRTDNAAEAGEGLGWFEQDFLCTIMGAIENL